MPAAPYTKFKNLIKSNVGNTWTPVLTAPAGEDLYIIQLDIASRNGIGVQVSIRITDTSEAETAYFLDLGSVPAGSTLQAIDGQKIVLEEGDILEIRCVSPGEVVDVVGSYVLDVNSI